MAAVAFPDVQGIFFSFKTLYSVHSNVIHEHLSSLKKNKT